MTQHAADWQRFTDSGTADMGSLSYREGATGAEDKSSQARFKLPEWYVLMGIRAHFTDGTNSDNDMVVNLDSHLGPAYDVKLKTFKDVGTGGADVKMDVYEDEEDHWTFDPRDVIVFTWSNPDTGNMEWAVEVFLKPVVTRVG